MSKFYLCSKEEGKFVRTCKAVDKITKLFILRGSKGEYIAESANGKRVLRYKWIEKDMCWRPVGRK